jgi:copper chaperone CopZ
MKYLKISLAVLVLALFASPVFSQSCHDAKAKASCCATKAASSAQVSELTTAGFATATFPVSGNCGMCKRTIEGAAMSVAGVQTANWDADAQLIKLSYDAEQTQLEQVKAKIAESGYDTEGVAATDEAYNALHTCCQYERVKP